ncbi:MFS transporter [Lacticaseibacillus pabuli]|uniref:MFS transporter n=1 Tax=Lacticaseibacillus pabuli TaxID=3025672 RepID=A0ABY7WSE2_9LACO|nr:MFS transporter [Lacticaseibacillus sp. KACC 23028]WDF81907.1 MFS transporter [Lacticaseibacillus sp. KACC 23028]
MTINTKRNLIGAYIYSFTAFFGITSLWVMYLGQQGLPLVLIGMCESIFHVGSFIFEVPSGILADRFGYKTVLIWGRLAAIISALLMLIGHSFWWFAISFIISAFSYNLQSGSLEAFIYESLPVAGREGAYARATSMSATMTEIASASGAVLAGFFVHWHFNFTYIIAIAIAAATAMMLYFLQEPQRAGAPHERQGTTDIVRGAWQVLRTNKLLRNLIMVDASISALGTGYYYYFQDVMSVRHFSSWAISALMLAGAGVNVLAVQLTPWLQKHFTKAQLISGIGSLMALCLLLTGFHWLPGMLALYLLSMSIVALLYPLFSSYYNALVPSAQRATLLSVASMVFSIIMIVLFPLTGWLVDRLGFNLANALLGVALILIMVPLLVRLRRNSNKHD